MSEVDVKDILGDMNAKILQEKISKLNERNEQRKAVETRRRKDRFELGSHAELAEVFNVTFKEYQKKIEQELTAAIEAESAGENRSKLTMRLDEIFDIIENLKKYLTESSMFLTAFDNEQAKKEFQEIKNKFTSTRETLLPNKKFSFNMKPKSDNNPKPVEVSAQVPLPSKPKANPVGTEFGFIDRCDEVLRLNGDEVAFKPIMLRNLSRCSVHVTGHPASVYIENVTDCTIACGPTRASVMVVGARSCRLYFASQQARLHDSVDCDFYLHVTTSPIIEDCCRLRFAPFLLHYDGIDDDFRQSTLNLTINNWNRVEDFRHLCPDVPSPNWSCIDESDRKELSLV